LLELGLKGKVALVTGGSRGIGRAVVERLADAGADVVINFQRDESAAAEVKAYADRAGVRALVVRGEVSRLEEAERIVRATVEEFGRLDLLVCNAGIWEGAPVDEMDEALWDRVIDVNLKGTWTICRAAVPHMKRARSGKIVIVSSTAGQRGEANVSNYAASKGGQISFCKSLATELAPYDINVNAVAPGWVETEMSSDVLEDAEQRPAIEQTIPLGRVATAEEIALPVIFLCTDWARHITGEVLNINGGSVLCG
jgi:3-oxoacyl-[acyl-carrier protein] reductase